MASSSGCIPVPGCGATPGTPKAPAADAPAVLVLGGCGFIGRTLVKYLSDNGLCSYIRVVDKRLPVMAHFGPQFKEVFENKSLVQFVQGDLSKDNAVQKAFATENGLRFSYVFNVAGETKFGMEDEVYEQNCLQVVEKCAPQAALHGVDKWIEVSTAHVYQHINSNTKAKEAGGRIKPWTKQAKQKYKAEETLKKIEGLNTVVLRPSIVYGVADFNGLCQRIVCAAVYKELKEKMKLLWTGSLKINTVHVNDVVRAMWLCAQAAENGSVYNLSDKSNTDQKSLNVILSKVFGIRTGFVGQMLCSLAKVKFESFTEGVNDKHLQPWSDLCKKHNIVDTPLTPYIDKELLYDYNLCIDGSAIEKLGGFQYSVPVVTEEALREQIQHYVDLNVFPPVLADPGTAVVEDDGDDKDDGDEALAAELQKAEVSK